MRQFEGRELRQQIFGSRGIFESVDPQKIKQWSETGSQLLEGVMRDVEAARRMRERLSTMINQFEDGTLARGRRPVRPPPGANNPAKQCIADRALTWWERLGRGQERTKEFKAFAGVLYQLAGFTMSSPAIHEQLTAAVKRRHAN